MDGLAAGRGGTLLVSGAAGIGKSRLVAQLQSLGAARGALVLVGACPPLREEAVAHAPLAELLRRLLDSIGRYRWTGGDLAGSAEAYDEALGALPARRRRPSAPAFSPAWGRSTC